MKNRKISSLSLAVVLAMCLPGANATSVYAVDVAAGEEKSDVTSLVVGSGEIFRNAGTVTAGTAIKGIGGFWQNTGTVNTGTLDWYGHTSDQGALAGTINATETFIYRGIAGNLLSRKVTGKIVTPVVEISGGESIQTGLAVSDSDALSGVGKIIVRSAGARTALTVTAEGVSVEAPVYLISTTTDKNDVRIEIAAGQSASFSEIHAVSGKTKIQTDNTASVTVGKLAVDAGGHLQLQVNGSKLSAGGDTNVSTVTLGSIEIADGGKLSTTVYETNQPDIHVTGDLNVTLGSGAVLDFGGNEKADRRTEKIFVDSKTIQVTVTDTENAPAVYLSSASETISRGEASITVTATAANNTGDAAADLSKLSGVVLLTSKTEGVSEAVSTGAASGATLAVEASGIYDAASGTLEVDADSGETTVTNVTVKKNTTVHGTVEMTATGLFVWRNEINDMNKRMGELRDSLG